MAKLPKKPNIVLSNIPEQNKRGANSLTIEEWNSIINKLKLQGDLTVRHLHQLHQLLVYSGSDTEDPYLDIELPPDGYGFLTDSVLKLRGNWNPTTNQPELSPFDKSKRGWLYRVTADAEAVNGFPGVRKDDWVLYNNDGYLVVFEVFSKQAADTTYVGEDEPDDALYSSWIKIAGDEVDVEIEENSIEAEFEEIETEPMSDEIETEPMSDEIETEPMLDEYEIETEPMLDEYEIESGELTGDEIITPPQFE